jgi:hypothetical protein
MNGVKPKYDGLKPKATSPGVTCAPLKAPERGLPTFSKKVTQWTPPGGHVPQPGQPPVQKVSQKMGSGPGYNDKNGFVNKGNPQGFEVIG